MRIIEVNPWVTSELGELFGSGAYLEELSHRGRVLEGCVLFQGSFSFCLSLGHHGEKGSLWSQPSATFLPQYRVKAMVMNRWICRTVSSSKPPSLKLLSLRYSVTGTESWHKCPVVFHGILFTVDVTLQRLQVLLFLPKALAFVLEDS